jgi:hypothetical protein
VSATKSRPLLAIVAVSKKAPLVSAPMTDAAQFDLHVVAEV